MTYAAIMTHVRPEPGAAPRLVCAKAIAARFGARLIGVGAEMIPPLAFDNGFYSVDAEWVTAMRESIEGQFKVCRDIFARETADLPAGGAAWLCDFDSPTPALAAASRSADLIVAGGAPRKGASSYRDVVPAELAIQAGRPVLVAPPTAPALSAARIVIAWRDTREARRALSDSLPFLLKAEKVLVLEICDHDATADAEVRTGDVAEALKRQGVVATAKVELHDHVSPSTRILDAARAFGADLIVLGCYGHSRLGEWVFGGVTRDLLAQDEAYLLLSH
jgi:nucleotide-binding universal stress UspA family protein